MDFEVNQYAGDEHKSDQPVRPLVKAFRYKKYFVRMWKVWLCFCEVTDEMKCRKHFGLTVGKDFDFLNCDGYFKKETYKTGGHVYFVVMRPERGLHVLVHECTHAALQILDDSGVDTKPGNDEPLCYLVEDLFEEAHKFYFPIKSK